jgi:hypothetical protein
MLRRAAGRAQIDLSNRGSPPEANDWSAPALP